MWLWLAAMLIVVWFMPNSWQVFRKYDPILVPKIAKGTAKRCLFQPKVPYIYDGAARSGALRRQPASLNSSGRRQQSFIYMIF